jgi:predicted RNA binding protein YcfA (HicA-like mRNA interferase family)
VSRLHGLNWRDVERVLVLAGFVFSPSRGKGSHRAYVLVPLPERTRLVIVPLSMDLPIGTVLSIIKQSGLTTTEFIDFLTQ